MKSLNWIQHISLKIVFMALSWKLHVCFPYPNYLIYLVLLFNIIFSFLKDINALFFWFLAVLHKYITDRKEILSWSSANDSGGAKTTKDGYWLKRKLFLFHHWVMQRAFALHTGLDGRHFLLLQKSQCSWYMVGEAIFLTLVLDWFST